MRGPGDASAQLSQRAGCTALPTFHIVHCPLPAPQPARTRKQNLLLFCKRLIGFVLSHWSKVVILGIIITLIVLVAIKV